MPIPTAVWSSLESPVQGIWEFIITFSEPVSGFALSDLRLRSNGLPTNIAPSSSNAYMTSNADGDVYQLTFYQPSSWAAATDYYLRLNRNQVTAISDGSTGPRPRLDTVNFEILAYTGDAQLLIEGDIDPYIVEPGGQARLEISRLFANVGTPTYEFGDGYTAPTWLAWISGGILLIFPNTGQVVDTDFTVPCKVTPTGEAAIEFDIIIRAIGDGSTPLPVWNTTLASTVVEETASETIDIAALVAAEVSITLDSGLESWMAFDGSELTLTNVPAVSMDTDFSLVFTATNPDGDAEGIYTLTVRDRVLPVWGTLAARTFEIDESTSQTIDLAGLVSGETSITLSTGYTLPSWAVLTGTMLAITAPAVAPVGLTETVELTATNADGSIDSDVILNINNVLSVPVWLGATQRRLEVDEGNNGTINVRGLVTGETSVVVNTPYTFPSWLSFSAGNLIVMDAPEVTPAGLTETVPFTASNVDGDVDSTVVVFIANVSSLPVWVAANQRRLEVDEGGNGSLDIRLLVSNEDSIAVDTSYTFPSWLSYSGGVLAVTNAPDVDPTGLTETVPFIATNADGDANADVVVEIGNIEALPVWSPLVDRQIELNENTTGTVDVSTLVTGETGITLRTGYTLPTWATFTANVLTLNAPGVTPANLTEQILLTATNADGDADSFIDVTVFNVPAVPVWVVESSRRLTVVEGQVGTLDVAALVSGETSLTLRTGYTLPTWAMFASGVLTVNGPPVLAEGLVEEVLFTATNADGDADSQVEVNITNLTLLPLWLQGNSLISNVNAGDTLDIDLDDICMHAERYEMIGVLPNFIRMTGGHIRIASTPVLREDYTWEIALRAINIDGTADEKYTVNVSASNQSLRNDVLFCEYPVNYVGDKVTRRGTSTIVREITDNDYATFSDHDDFDINIAIGGVATEVDAIFLKGKNIDSWSVTPSGGSGTGFTNRAIQESVVNFEGAAVDTTVWDFQHDLAVLDSPFTASNVRLRVSGTDFEIYAIMVLKIGVSIDANNGFTEIYDGMDDRTGEEHITVKGRGSRQPSIGDQRFKFQVPLVAWFEEQKQLYEEFLYWMERNVNFTLVNEFNRNPMQGYPAAFASLEVTSKYVSYYKGTAETLTFLIKEK